jgi:hypothetical protein
VIWGLLAFLLGVVLGPLLGGERQTVVVQEPDVECGLAPPVSPACQRPAGRLRVLIKRRVIPGW